jgi:hypothetical protein
MFHATLWLEMRRWRSAGRSARLWWRDDDAAGASPALDRLLALAEDLEVPLTLAVIPAGDMAGLGEALAGAARVNVVQHGVDHQNRRMGAAAGEFPHDWPMAEVAIALRRGWSLMQGLPRARQVFTPPWNDLHPELVAALRVTGYAGLSANGELGVEGNPPRLDVHLDLLRWRGGARFRGRGRFLGALAAEMRRRRLAGRWDAPIGVLTHHLDHTPAAWTFLTAFLAWSRRDPALGWVSLPQVLPEAAPVAIRLPPRHSAPAPVGARA